MKNVIWTVRIKSAPTAVKYCKRCGVKTDFISSGLFRINAQQKNLDVWLVYKCSTCDTTWNLTILSRVSPRSIPSDLLRGFHDNDSDLAMRYATDATLVKRNGVEINMPEIEVVGMDIETNESVIICLTSELPLEIRVEAVLRKKLDLSRNEFDKLLASGNLVCVSGHNLKKCKLQNKVIVELKRE